MAVITLTSDLGAADPYLATVKGRLLRRCPDVNLVDVSHEVPAWNSQQAAFVLRQTFPHFAPDTIHWIGVYSQAHRRERYLVVYHRDQYFIGPDDGLFSLLFEEHPEFIFAIREGVGAESGYPGIYADSVYAAAHLAAGADMLDIASQVQTIAERKPLRALELPDLIRASVIHIDRFGNVILNVDRALLDRVGKGRPFLLRLRKNDQIDQLSQRYSDVPFGERLAFFNAAGYLEIAINQGNAAKMHGLKPDDLVQLVF
jgi:hypothetical protein